MDHKNERNHSKSSCFKIERVDECIEYSDKSNYNFLYQKKISIQVVDVDNFIQLKKNFESIIEAKNEKEQKNSDIIEITQIIRNFGIKLQEFDSKLIREKEVLYVELDKKMDSTNYFLESNINKYRQDLRGNISGFDKEIRLMTDELRNEVINVYSKECYSALFFIEDRSIPIKKLVDRSKIYQKMEIDIESDDKSKFKNLDDLTYEYDLKSR